MRTHRSAAVGAASFLLLAGAALTLAPAAHAAPIPGGVRAADRHADFDGDGHEDVLVGAPGGTVNGHGSAGYVTVQYGSSGSLTTTDRTVIHQDTPGVAGATEPGDAFGQAVASGDLDADGYDDAIVGAPGEDLGTASDAGAVVILWGSPDGLSGYASQWLESSAPTAGEAFGAGLAAAHFTDQTPGDLLAVLGRADLWTYGFDSAAAAPTGRTATGTATATGTPTGATGRTATRATTRTTARQHTRAVRENAVPLRGVGRTPLAAADSASDTEPRDVAPKALATGDYDRNGYADLVVGGLAMGSDSGQGWSRYFTGQADGLVYGRDLRGGPVVASGDVNGDGYDDLATGEPHSPDDSGATLNGGRVGIYYGSADGPAGTAGPDSPPQWWTQDTPGVAGAAEAGDGWGTDLSLGDTDRDGYADLAVGASGEDIGTTADAGAVWLLRGSAAGLATAGSKDFNQDTSGIPGVPEKGDLFGGQVRLTDHDGDGRFALLADAPGEDGDDGIVWFVPTGSGGLTASGSWTYNGASLGAPSQAALFGAAIDE